MVAFWVISIMSSSPPIPHKVDDIKSFLQNYTAQSVSILTLFNVAKASLTPLRSKQG